MSKKTQGNDKRMMAFRIGALIMASLMVLGSIAGVLLYILNA